MTRQQTRTRTPQRKAGRKTPASRRKSPASRRTGVTSRRKSPARRKSSARKTKPKQKLHKKKQSLRHGFHRMLSGGEMNVQEAQDRLAAIKDTLDRAKKVLNDTPEADQLFKEAQTLVAQLKTASETASNAPSVAQGAEEQKGEAQNATLEQALQAAEKQAAEALQAAEKQAAEALQAPAAQQQQHKQEQHSSSSTSSSSSIAAAGLAHAALPKRGGNGLRQGCAFSRRLTGLGETFSPVQENYLVRQIKQVIEKSSPVDDDGSATVQNIIEILATNLGKTEEELQNKQSEIKKILENEGTSEEKATEILNVFFLNGYSRERLAMGMGVAGLTTGMLGYTLGKKHGKKSKK